MDYVRYAEEGREGETFKENFYYISDSALFSEDNLKMAASKGIKLITRMPDNVLIAKSSIEEAADKLNSLQILTLKNAKGESVVYLILEKTCEYAGHMLSLAVCCS